MRDERVTTPGRLAGSLLKWVERLLLFAGAAALLWCGLLVVEALIAQRQARRSLESIAGSVPRPAESTTVPSRAPTRPPESVAASASGAAAVSMGSPLAELLIPRLGVSAVVLHGSDARTLRLGLGHIENTAMPGAGGNVAIAGHRDSFFRPLRNVAVGDDILMKTPRERLHYKVSSFRVVKSTDVSVLDPTQDSTLTLVTCYPFWFIGQAPDRFVVRAIRVGTSEAVTASTGVPASRAVWSEADQRPIDRRLETAGPGVVASGQELAKSRRPPEVLVRETVERFRQIYNAQPASRSPALNGGPLMFETCTVTTEGDRATAACQSVARSGGDLAPLQWSFRLRQEGGRWAILDVTTW